MKTREAIKKPLEESTLHPEVAQQKAADPMHSAGVSASAGTGKTKVLTDRLLRLLLPRDGQPGTKPHKILCLTYTKAAASEMRTRLSEVLSQWAVLPEEALIGHKKYGLQNLLGRPPKKEEIKAARKLFAEVIDAPGGLNIMTIHAFCQSVLGRFPLEAAIAPGFEVLENDEALFASALESAIKKAQQNPGSSEQESLARIAAAIPADKFHSLIRSVIRERTQIKAILGDWGPDGLYTKLCKKLNIKPGHTPESIIFEACDDSAFSAENLKNAATIMAAAKGSDEPALGQRMLNWLNFSQEKRSNNFSEWCSIFFTSSGPRSRSFPAKSTGEKHPGIIESLAAESARLLALQDTANCAASALLTADLFHLAATTLIEYDKFKQRSGLLDFDDLIYKTLKLLKENPGWVLYKLDQGLDHILVDEAQDTNPEQWEIVESLADEFFAGYGARDGINRTIFTVGDYKQSIYGFNRADPDSFAAMQKAFSNKAQAACRDWEPVALDISFRSAPSILKAVDAVFALPAAAKGLGEHEISHSSYRRGQEGLVELWPLTPYVTPKNNAGDLWNPPVTAEEKRDGQNELAKAIAARIKEWIGREILPSRDRSIEPGDIMILLRTRTAFFNKLVRALKEKNIPVSGVDRMILNEEIAIQDLLAAAHFALLPGDDLNLACLLKSPLLGWSEEELMEVAAYRPEHTPLWTAVQKAGRDTVFLEKLIETSRTQRPYEFFSMLLAEPCPADPGSGLRAMKSRLGEDAQDPLDELLAAALNFEHDHIPSLQGFLHWQERGHADIKRELEEEGSKVRIMTVHGAKGLQAPVVILPDTMRSQSGNHVNERLLWPEKTGLDLPLFSPRKDSDCKPYKEAYEAFKIKQEEEYRRLLYVAMTRAEDRLYVCGHTKEEAPEGSWYALVETGLKSLKETEKEDDGILRLHNPQIKNPDHATQTAPLPETTEPPPEWLFTPAPKEPGPPAQLVPSRPAEPDPPVSSPLAGDAQRRFRRGNVTHKLLQFLPDLPTDQRRAAATKFVQHFAADLPQDMREGIITETLNILENPEFSAFFTPGSLAEVPVTGFVNGQLVSGQIDRLLIMDQEIWILDYKTNRPPPTDPKDVPAIYRRQMRAYRDTLAAAYPQHKIHTALLWTDGPRLMKLEG